jgi:hypothetical protein
MKYLFAPPENSEFAIVRVEGKVWPSLGISDTQLGNLLLKCYRADLAQG